MPGAPPDGRLVFVDACTWINLFATGRLEAILGSLPYQWATSAYVVDKEVLTVWSREGRQQELLALRDLERSGLVDIREVITAEEKAELVRFALHLDDGESSVCALAVCNAGVVATDDTKALRILQRLAPTVVALTTPLILQSWAERSHPSQLELRALVEAVERRARFVPRAGTPGADWWGLVRR